jgi:hypothetical protein
MDLFRIFDRRPDHPMATEAGAREVLESLQSEPPLEVVERLAHWAGTLHDTEGFGFRDRLTAVTLLDDFSRPVADRLYATLLARLHAVEPAQRRTFDMLSDFWRKLSAAYGRCVADNERSEKGTTRAHDELALALGRTFRCAGQAARLRCLRFLAIGNDTWPQLYRPYAFAEVAHVDEHAVVLYPHEPRTTPRAELLRVLALSLAATDELPAEQIELAWRILGRFAISFAWSREPQPACNFVADLSGGKPYHRRDRETAAASKRHFGSGPALGKLEDIERLSEANMLTEEARFGREYTPAQVVSVIRHLRMHLGAAPPRRRYPRTAANVSLSVLHGYRPICQRVPAVDAATKTLDKAGEAARKKATLQLQAEEIESAPEAWKEKDRSDWGMGVEIPAGAGKWAEPGVLVGIRENEAAPLWVGAIRRLDMDEKGPSHCGVQILSKKPLACWMRMLGREDALATKWETTSAKYQFNYLRVVLLPDARMSHDHPVMLMEASSFVPGQTCELMLGGTTRMIRMAEFLEHGADYVRLAFAWERPETKSA